MARPGDHKHHLVPNKKRFGTADQMKVEVVRVWKVDEENRPLSFDVYCVGCGSETRFSIVSEKGEASRYACQGNHVLYGKDLSWKSVAGRQVPIPY